MRSMKRSSPSAKSLILRDTIELLHRLSTAPNSCILAPPDQTSRQSSNTKLPETIEDGPASGHICHEDRGTGLSEGVAELIDEPVEFGRRTVGADYMLGNRGSRGRLLLEAKYRDREYQNFREDTQFRLHS